MVSSRARLQKRAFRGFIAVLCLLTALFGLQAPAPAASAVAIRVSGVGYDQSCAVDSTGKAWCMGHNNSGQLGDGTFVDSALPVQVSGAQTWASIDAGDAETCAVTIAGAGYCWGRNNVGQLGINSTGADAGSPVLVSGGYTWRSITVGDQSACGVTTSNAGYCWGLGGNGQVGDGNSVNVPAPSLVSGGLSWSYIKMSDNAGRHACGITTSGDAYCWGDNTTGQLGTNDHTASPTPVPVNGGYKWSKISAGGSTSCGVTTSGVGYCWGSNYMGVIGNGGGADALVPTSPNGGYTWIDIVPGGGVTCGVRSNGAGYCWGADGLGALGDGTNSDSTTPVPVAGGYTFASIAIGGGNSCGVTTASGIYCWGWNAFGQLGDNNTGTNRNAPFGVLNLTNLQSTSTVSVSVDPSFLLSIGGYNSGTCNGATINATSSTATAVPLRPTSGTNAIGGQTLTVSGNASLGYTLFVRSTGALSDGNGHTIPDWTGTNAAPTAFPAAGNARLGYTTDHALSGSATRFQTNLWAGFPATNQEVATLATQPAADVTHVCMQAGIATSTAAGVYSTTIIYTAVPSF